MNNQQNKIKNSNIKSKYQKMNYLKEKIQLRNLKKKLNFINKQYKSKNENLEVI